MIAGSWLIASVCIDLMKADVVDDLRRVRQQLADPGARLAVLRELEDRRRDREATSGPSHAGEPLALADRVGQLACRGASSSVGL